MPNPEDTVGEGHNSAVEVDFDQLEKQLDDLQQASKNVSEATGSLRSKIQSILDETGYHKRALGLIREIDAMSETKRADFLRTFEPLFDCMHSNKWQQEQADLLSAVGGDE